jgi:hypothetical protein
MWERIGESSTVILVAVVLFLLFAVALFFIERDNTSKRRQQRQKPYLLPRPQNSPPKNSAPQLRRNGQSSVCSDITLRKIS